MSAPLLAVENVSRRYGSMKAVDGVSFEIAAGEAFGIVGESGSGKSTLARMVMALDRPTGGRILFEGQDLFALSASRLRAARPDFQMVFQDPYGSLDPRMRVERIVSESLSLKGFGRTERRRAAGEALEAVGLRAEDGRRYPHEFSGGQRQRIAIARALATQPKLLVADEPVSALDLSVQAQVLNLLLDLKESRGLALLFISHNLAVVEHVTDRLAVMHRGRIVETGPSADVFRAPRHPYTRLLIDAIPDLDAPRRRPAPAGEGVADGGCASSAQGAEEAGR